MRSQALAAPMGVVNLSREPQADATSALGGAKQTPLELTKEQRMAVYGLDVSPSDRLLLLLLADYRAWTTGLVWPCQETMAKKLNKSERDVRRCLVRLEKRGLIIRRGVGSKGQVLWSLPRFDAAHVFGRADVTVDAEGQETLRNPDESVRPPRTDSSAKLGERVEIQFGTNRKRAAGAAPKEPRAPRAREPRPPTPVYDVHELAASFTKAACAYRLTPGDVVECLTKALAFRGKDGRTVADYFPGDPTDEKSALHMSLVGSLRTHGAFLQDQRKRFGAPFTEAPSPAPIRSVPKPKAEPSPPTIEAPPREGLPSSHEEFLALLKKQRRAGSMKAALEGSC